MATEKFANTATTTLSAAITSTGATTLTVTSASLFPAAQFRILIDTELMLVTGVSGTTFTVTRGIEGTTAATHLILAPVTLILTTGSLNQMIADNVQFGPYASLPAAEKAGRLYLSSDGPYTFRDNGSSWDAFYRGQAVKIPLVSNFPTWINQGSSTVTDTTAGINLFSPADSSDSAKMLVKAIPGATPYSCIIHMRGFFTNVNYSGYGFVWHDSVSGNWKAIDYICNSGGFQLSVGKGQPYFINANYWGINTPIVYEWFKFSDDGTNQIFSISVDGVTWFPAFSHARNTDVTPNQVGFYVDPRNGTYPVYLTVFHYQETSP